MLIVNVLTRFLGQLIFINNFAFDTLPLKWLEDTLLVCWWAGCLVDGWVAGLSGTKTKLNSS